MRLIIEEDDTQHSKLDAHFQIFYDNQGYNELKRSNSHYFFMNLCCTEPFLVIQVLNLNLRDRIAISWTCFLFFSLHSPFTFDRYPCSRNSFNYLV